MTDQTVFRYNLAQPFVDELFKFSKIHQFDNRPDFKEAWNIWLENNQDLVENESRRLQNIGYEGDILNKIYKSSRYYFRKKSTVKKEPITRRVYVGTDKELLDAMDEHITFNIENNKEYKPSTGFVDFCKKNVDLLKTETGKLVGLGITNSNQIHSKIKKTYKNRYFIHIHNHV